MIKYSENELRGKTLDFTKEDTFVCLYVPECFCNERVHLMDLFLMNADW